MNRYFIISGILGQLLMLFSTTLTPPIIFAYYDNDSYLSAFGWTFIISFSCGFLLWLQQYSHTTNKIAPQGNDLRTSDGFIITVLIWLVLSLFGCLPFLIYQNSPLSFTDAFFESLSAWTTTGATVIPNLDSLPRSILFYRQQLQWFGGMGIIVLAVAVLPRLGVGGMQLFRAETPGPMKDSKLKPRITDSAKTLWNIYLCLTIACAIAYSLAGMSYFDAIAHSFSTVAIGGFSTHDASIGYYNNVHIEAVCVVFMLISSINFALHYTAASQRSPMHYFNNSELRFFVFLIILGCTVTVTYLAISKTFSIEESLRHGIFETVSIATTTGFATENYAYWPTFVPFLLFFMAFVGGCSGSTGGGMKVIRALLILKQGLREIRRLIHPSAVFPIKIGKKLVVEERVLDAVWGFLSVYLMLYLLMVMALLASGLDFLTAFSAIGASINNLGPGLGGVSENFSTLSDFAKWVCCFGMLLGRLEIFTLLVLFTPTFWRN